MTIPWGVSAPSSVILQTTTVTTQLFLEVSAEETRKRTPGSTCLCTPSDVDGANERRRMRQRDTSSGRRQHAE